MKVTATKVGYFGGRLRVPNEKPHDTFEVPDGMKALWFEPVKADDAQADRGEKSKGSKGKGSDDLT